MDIETLKEALGDKFGPLKAYVDDLTGQRDAARQESIAGRKALKAKVDEQAALIARTFERLGVESADELETLPDGKGQAEALKQFEARLKKSEKLAAEALAERDTLKGQVAKAARDAAVRAAVSKHEFIDADVAGMLLERGIRQDGEQVLFEADSGKLIPLDEGAAFLAKTKPHLVKAAGAPGSGYRDGGGKPPTGNWAGSREERTAAIAARFPDLNKA